MARPITVNVNVDSWAPLFGPSQPNSGLTLSRATLAIPNNGTGPNGRKYAEVFADSTGRQDNIMVRDNVTLWFNFPQWSPAPNADKRAFYPVGISLYKQNDGANAALDSLPRDSVRFGIGAPVGNQAGIPFVLIDDPYTLRGVTDADWKYMIVIQDNFGNIGVIDPDIENDQNPA